MDDEQCFDSAQEESSVIEAHMKVFRHARQQQTSKTLARLREMIPYEELSNPHLAQLFVGTLYNLQTLDEDLDDIVRENLEEALGLRQETQEPIVIDGEAVVVGESECARIEDEEQASQEMPSIWRSWIKRPRLIESKACDTPELPKKQPEEGKDGHFDS